MSRFRTKVTAAATIAAACALVVVTPGTAAAAHDRIGYFPTVDECVGAQPNWDGYHVVPEGWCYFDLDANRGYYFWLIH